jgi:pimeloyl-ACP methyl ester carboxylesterase
LALVVLVAVGGCGSGTDAGDRSAPPSTTTTTEPVVDAPEPRVERMIEVGGHQIALTCQGEGGPTVMVEMGAGQTSSNWLPLLERMAQDRLACVYERAGVGTSEPGPDAGPRTATSVSADLEGLLAAASIPTPIVLVSHSIGGMYAQLFAARYPEQVAGLVFIDPRTAAYQAGYRAVLTDAERAADVADLASLPSSDPMTQEILGADGSAAEVAAAGPVPDVPLVVLTAGIRNEGQSDADVALWRESHAQLAAQSSTGTSEVVDDADHEIWRSDAPLVAETVDRVARSAG